MYARFNLCSRMRKDRAIESHCIRLVAKGDNWGMAFAYTKSLVCDRLSQCETFGRVLSPSTGTGPSPAAASSQPGAPLQGAICTLTCRL